MPLTALPDALLSTVTSFLDVPDHPALAATCKSLADIAGRAESWPPTLQVREREHSYRPLLGAARNVRGLQFHDTVSLDLEFLADFPLRRLRSFSVRSSPVCYFLRYPFGAAWTRAIAALSHCALTSLYLDYPLFQDDLQLLVKMPLRKLSLPYVRAAWLPKGLNLSDLAIGTDGSAEDLAALDGLPDTCAMALFAASSAFGDQELRALGHLKKLEKLVISATTIVTSDGLLALSTPSLFPGLTVLHYWPEDLGKIGMLHISYVQTLQEVLINDKSQEDCLWWSWKKLIVASAEVDSNPNNSTYAKYSLPCPWA